MKKRIPYWQTVGFLFTAVVGTLLHFLFDWTGGSVIAALFSAVNESIWEHLKLLFYPMAAFALVEYLNWGKREKSFWCIKLLGILLGFVLVIGVYYTYTGILGMNVDWVNITLFFLAAGAAYWTETQLYIWAFSCPVDGKIPAALLFLLAILFTVFTFYPPRIPLFGDPITGTYGFYGRG